MNTTQNEIVIVVNAYLSGSFLAPKFLEKGYYCIHVTTQCGWENDSYHETFRGGDFIKNIIVENEFSLDDVLLNLEKYKIKLIIPGAESGVILADNLAYRLGMCTNDYKLLFARRNKFAMQEALKANKLRSIFQNKFSDIENVLQWKNKNNFRRIVLKPLMSSASDGVFYCEDEESIHHAFNMIHNKEDIFGNKNIEVLVQEYIAGPEYILNTVSCNGKHFFVDVWKGYSVDENVVSNDVYADIVYPSEPEYKIICEYLSKVLDSLGIMNGPAHSEVRLDKEGPCLIEVGARLAGRVDFSAIEQIYGCSQLSLSIDALLNPKNFVNTWDKYMLPIKQARYVYFFSNLEGIINKDIDDSNFKSLETLYCVKFFIKQGDFLQKTSKVSRVKRPGFSYLISGEKSKIDQDYSLIKMIEQNFYELLVG